MSLRIIWGGPWNRHCAAAREGAQIVGELAARGHVVEVLRSEVGRAARLTPLASNVTVRFWNEVSVFDSVRNADAIVIGLGDDYDSYGGMLGDFSALGAVVIFHDTLLANLAYAWAAALPRDGPLLEQLQKSADHSGRRNDAELFSAGFQALTHTRPILEWFASAAVGAVLHADFDFDCVRAACPGPVAVLPHPSEGDHALVPRYVDALLPLVDSAVSGRPVIMAGQRLGRTLAGFGLDARDPAVERVGLAFDSLYASHEKAT